MNDELQELSAKLCEASESALIAIRRVALSKVRQAERGREVDGDWLAVLAISDTAHNLPVLAMNPAEFSPEMLGSSIQYFKEKVGTANGSDAVFWSRVQELAEWPARKNP